MRAREAVERRAYPGQRRAFPTVPKKNPTGTPKKTALGITVLKQVLLLGVLAFSGRQMQPMHQCCKNRVAMLSELCLLLVLRKAIRRGRRPQAFRSGGSGEFGWL